jgi:hypothetical protein
MTVQRDLGAGLTADIGDDTLEVVFPGGRSSIRFAGRTGPVQASLRYGTNLLTADVSFQPGAVVRELDQTAREEAVDPNRWRLAVLAVLRDWSGRLGWCAQQPELLVAAVGALTHPLLAHAYSRGHAPIGEVPRWARPVLRCDDPASAAKALTEQANRRLTRAVAESLVARPTPATVELAPLSLAAIATELVSVDELANVLEVPITDRAMTLPTVDQIREARRGLELYTSSRRAALMVDVARHHDAVELADVMRELWWVRDRVEHPLPTKLADLRATCRRHVPVLAPQARPTVAPEAAPTRRQRVAPTPVARVDPPAAPVAGAITHARRPVEPAPVARRAPTPVEALDPATQRQRRLATPLVAPRLNATQAATPPTRWPIQPALLGLHHHQAGDLRFVVPTSSTELEQWGVLLHNCVGSFARAVAAGVSYLVGVERDDVLVACVEINPRTQSIRQMSGRRNQPLSGQLGSIIERVLRERGIVVMFPALAQFHHTPLTR